MTVAAEAVAQDSGLLQQLSGSRMSIEQDTAATRATPGHYVFEQAVVDLAP